MKREWLLDELLALAGSATSFETPLNCIAPLQTRGRYVRELSAHPGFADVTLTASPGSEFLFRLGHVWPDEVGAEEADSLDRALLLGVVEAALRCPQPPWGCTMECIAVQYSKGNTTPIAVKIAASMALQDLVQRPGWSGRIPPAPEVA